MNDCECLKWKYNGNAYLEADEVSLAIAAYDKALSFIGNGERPQQEGIVLLMRAAAYQQRAAELKQELQAIVNELLLVAGSMVPSPEVSSTSSGSKLETAFPPNQETAAAATSSSARQPQSSSSAIAISEAFRRILQDTASVNNKNNVLDQGKKQRLFRRCQYRHGLYQYALLQAVQDALRTTQLLPNYANAWRQAADLLSELWKLKESASYYERAISLDPTVLDDTDDDSLLLLEKVSSSAYAERLRERQHLLDNIKSQDGWSENTMRLALDAAG